MVFRMPSRIKRLWHRLGQSIKKGIGFVQNQIITRFLLPLFFQRHIKNIQIRETHRERPCFLLICPTYCDENPSLGPSNEVHAVIDPLQSADVADLVTYHLDADYPAGLWGPKHLIHYINEVKPDLTILSSYHFKKPTHPPLDVLVAIKSHTGVPFLNIWHDSLSDSAAEAAQELSQVVDLNILLDSGKLKQRFGDSHHYLRLWAPLDFNTFYPGPEEQERDIPVSFLGSTGSYRDIRNTYIHYLNDQGLQVFRAGGQREAPITLDEYAAYLRRSQISLNFSFSLPGTHQLKVRVFEIMFSGALLIENENDETKQFFEPMVDYVSFSSEADLADKVQYFLKHPEERTEIARNGYKKATTQYSHKEFWKKILDQLEKVSL